MDELVDARGVGEDGRFDLDRAVGSEQVGKWPGRVGVVVFRGAKRNGHDWRGSLGRPCLRILRRLLPEGRGNGSPNGLNLFVHNSVKRSQNGICFRQLTCLRSQPKSDSCAATPPGMDWKLSRKLRRADRVKSAV